MSAELLFLGQAGVRLAAGGEVLYIDPYLTDSVALTYGEHLRRMSPAPLTPEAVDDATWVLITHAHLDHADPDTLGPISQSSPECRFMCPPSVIDVLTAAGIARERIVPASERWLDASGKVAIRAVPAAHLTIDRDVFGDPACVGYLVRTDGRTIYHSGDTIPHQAIIDAVRAEGHIDYALLPVNERNYYRDAQGIVGNMSVREALQMATDIDAGVVVPIHWDLFADNCTPRAEIELVHRLTAVAPAMLIGEAGSRERLW